MSGARRSFTESEAAPVGRPRAFIGGAQNEGTVAYGHRDAEGFNRLNARRFRTLEQRRKKLKLDE